MKKLLMLVVLALMVVGCSESLPTDAIREECVKAKGYLTTTFSDGPFGKSITLSCEENFMQME